MRWPNSLFKRSRHSLHPNPNPNPNPNPPLRLLLLPPNPYSKPLSLLADRCSSMSELKQVHAQMVVSGRVHDAYAASRLLSFAALSPSGDLPYAALLFRQTLAPNSFMLNTLLRALAAGPDPSAALLLYARARRVGSLLPGKHTFPFLLKACANACCSKSVVAQIHTHVFKHGLDLDLYVVNGLVRCYASCGLLGSAHRLFDETPERNLILWTTIISGYAQNSQSDEALWLFDQMVQFGIEPCDATLSSVLSACTRSGGLELGKQIHVFIREKGIEVGVILGTALVDMYAKNGAIFDALKVFEEMPERNTATWNAVICGLAHHGHATEAIELFWEMKRLKFQPNDVTFVGVLSACCNGGLLELGRRVFGSMEEDYGVEPKIQHFGCMVDLLGRSGRLEEAEELINGMRWGADVVVWGALLNACKNYGNIAIAERVVKEILKVEPDNHGVYVVLSNMYAEVGRWEDVVRSRKVLRDGQLKKVAGWSSVDGDS
ncbi:Pentatricopeptide repeat-containing protein [Ananas comosus]|uniref:Pentatricopeptide repeat-containing protein n=1 Tax=Ananas comosus TaxID=4615 RepID=A0A199VCU2_ANACO|nr:Pentatricopeptide repeat-containing protein [Ananas comosus]